MDALLDSNLEAGQQGAELSAGMRITMRVCPFMREAEVREKLLHRMSGIPSALSKTEEQNWHCSRTSQGTLSLARWLH